jgi:tRNA G26 N,N-dimethylase Trm1
VSKPKLVLHKGEQSVFEDWGMWTAECHNCGRWQSIVRPGKEQCDHCGSCSKCGGYYSWGDVFEEGKIQECYCVTGKNRWSTLKDLYAIEYIDGYPPGYLES